MQPITLTLPKDVLVTVLLAATLSFAIPAFTSAREAWQQDEKDGNAVGDILLHSFETILWLTAFFAVGKQFLVARK